MGTSYDVAIAGAGIVGAACAAECAAAGLKVAVVDAGPNRGGATAAGMGHIAVIPDTVEGTCGRVAGERQIHGLRRRLGSGG